MNQNDVNRYKCKNSQLVEQLVTKLHVQPPKEYEVENIKDKPLTRRERERLAAELAGNFL